MELDQQQPMRRSSGRRKARGGGGGDAKKSKPPRRGMGVAKLEQRLREQGEIVDRPPQPLPPATAVAAAYHYGQTWNPVGFPGFYGLVGSDRRLHHFGGGDADENAVKCYSLHCNACHKKKRINGDQNVLNQDRAHTHSVGNYGNKVEVVAVHRRGSNWEGGSNQRVVMEYDFFPAAAGGGGGGLAGESAAVGGFDGSNCVDLSLKLSY